ncbi:efflux transporter outer membrane subunit [Agrilutibacter solisilvae]|uniref:Efflux transporter outer membrane subunit n=1 Tax=Agrilutibacter solisilvae TaxID=2763317 RepID=A0A975AT65_9GAMM|nr:efflux transporter outer membrane subunit [Lysobacter solisilvae]QSX78789.1 efflux transporter outer membrane subunit [Lysobacter solisilvae]
MLGPDYVRPTVEVPGEYRFAGAAPAATLDAVDPWWHGFGDAALDTLVTEGLAQNRDLRVAVARVDEFAARLSGTRGQAFPQVGYGASASRQRASTRGATPFPPGVNPISESYSSVLSASWELDLWGRIRRETEAARADLLASDQARRGVALTLVASIVVGYVNLLDLDRQLQVSRDTAAGRQRSVDLFRVRLEGGAVSDFEMQQVLAEYETAAAAIPQVVGAIAQQEDALSVLVGRNPGPIARASTIERLGLPAVPADMPAQLLERRPDILEAEQQLVAANARIGVARALYFPSISLTGTAGYASADLGQLFTGPARTWSFVGQLLGPLFAGGQIDAANRQAEARRDQVLSAYESTIQNAFRDVEDALATVRSSREVQASYERRVASLRTGVELARLRYDHGYSDYLEVLDTERSLFSAELALSSARGDSYRALADLYRALGGDWSVDAAQRTASASSPAGTAQVRP